MEYIGLGSNCSITYQLNKYGLRTNSYPFDWAKITLQQLIVVLENNFADYVDSIEIKKNSSLHPQLDDINNLEINTNSVLTTNSYGITFAHEFIDKYELDEFKNKLQMRVDRFKNLLSIGKKIKFIRIEISVIKTTFHSYVLKLLSILDNFAKDYVLILVIQENSKLEKCALPLNVKIYTFKHFDPDWKMDAIDWNNVFI